MSGLLELAARVEAATGPERELDEAIQTAVFDRPTGRRYDYTGSLDTALSLKPNGWHVGILTECDEGSAPHACLTENEEPCRDATGDGATMALSLVAAALRAREALSAQPQGDSSE